MTTATGEHSEGGVPGTGATAAEPGAPTGVGGSATATPAQAQADKGKRAVTQSPSQDDDDSEFGKGFRKGARSAKREFHEEFEREHGTKFDAALTEWKSLRESHAKGEKHESAEMVKLQRQLAQAQDGAKKLEERIGTLVSENTGYKVTSPIKDAVARVLPKSEKYASYFVAEMAKRVKLDDDGDLTVLTAEGKPNHKLSLDDLAKELAEAMPDLVTPPRKGTGVTPGAPVVQSRETAGNGLNGTGTSRIDRVAALARVMGR